MSAQEGLGTRLAVCLCTHNPDADMLARVLDALCTQVGSTDQFRVVVVDNASSPPLDEPILGNFRQTGIPVNLIREPALGLVHARVRAIEETREPLLLFLDDDNELIENYIARAIEIAEADPDIGCFGGKTVLPDGLVPPKYLGRYVRFLAIRDDGDTVITAQTDQWGPWEPIGAGAVVRRELARHFVTMFQTDRRVRELGRRGSDGLYCCEDNLMMRSAARIGLKSSYQPDLVLVHHVKPDRFRLRYMLRLLYWFGRSDVVLSHIMWGGYRDPFARGNLTSKLLTLLRGLMSPLRSLFELPIYLGRRAEIARSGGVRQHLQQDQIKREGKEVR